jgi:hypothetical protein
MLLSLRISSAQGELGKAISSCAHCKWVDEFLA